MEGLRSILSVLTQGPTVPFFFLLLVLVWVARTTVANFRRLVNEDGPVSTATESEDRRLPWLIDRLFAAAILLASWSIVIRMLGFWGAILLGFAAGLCFCWAAGLFVRWSWLVESAAEWLSRWSATDSTVAASGDAASDVSEAGQSRAATRRRLWRTPSDYETDAPLLVRDRKIPAPVIYRDSDDGKSWWPVAVASLVLVLLIVLVLLMPRGGSKHSETANVPIETEVLPARVPLALAALEDRTVNEEELVCLKVGVENVEAIRSRLRWSLGPNSPLGATIDPESGVFSWMPSEEDGPGIYPILVRVEDSRNEEMDEAALVVKVAEVNDSLEMDEIDEQSVTAGDTLTLIATARDPNIPQRDLRYSLALGAPRGLSIDSETGALTWPTTESQAPGEFPITVRVRESGRGSLRAEAQFIVTVTRSDPPAVVAAMEEPPASSEAMEEPPAAPAAVAAAEEPPAPAAKPETNQPEEPSLLPVAMTEPAKTSPPEPPPVMNSIGMTLVPIADGEFRMGSRESAEDLGALIDRPSDRFQDELPLHAVRITQPFLMSKHEVTVGNFREFVLAEGYITEAERHDHGGFGYNAATNRFERAPRFNWKNPGWSQTDEHPVVIVSWHDAVEFCRWLSRKEGRTYRLPTEAEWEYACRAGTDTWYSTGDSAEGLASTANLGDEQFRRKVRPNYHSITLASSRDAQPFPVPVGRFDPNGFGLCDMHGNVFEWCSDWYGPRYYAESPRSDPTGPSSGRTRSIRGGGFYSAPFYCRSAFRNGLAPETTVPYLGFRVVVADE